jgi:2-hydroxychromene-2-carboxylate isomerase
MGERVTHIDYYFSLNSPWSYLGSARFREIVRTHGASVSVKPVKFGPIFERTGGLPLPRRSPQRRAYRMMELGRWRDYLQVPIVTEPKYFPADEISGVRLVLAAEELRLDALGLALEIGRAVWELNENIAEPSVLDAACQRAKLDRAALASVTSLDALDRRYDALTAEALQRGVFGAPSYVLESGEIFWGQDRLDLLRWRLAGGAQRG